MIPDFSGDYVNFESTQDGDICEILDEGKVEFNETLKKDMFNIKVKLNEKVKTYSPNNTIGREFQKAWGMDTKDWKGNKFEILHVQGKMQVRPIKVKKVK
jgi:hypothetical protein